ncbi:MAG: aminoacetone oxidase family FAD-binding enzyme [Eubacteriales bacterium]|nr:aminoacetone oxidase family FAD-binding enzyme [Eubacteriales bacterium]
MGTCKTRNSEIAAASDRKESGNAVRRVVVIGGGAAGLMAAVKAAECGARVTLLEANEKPGKKLLVTGNGRCNLTNLDQSDPKRYRGADKKFTDAVFAKFSVQDTLDCFRAAGLLLTDRDGYVYPLVGQASAVVEILLAECRRKKVKLKTNERAVSIERKNGEWSVLTQGWHYEADAVVIAAGSKAAPATGAGSGGYQLAEQLGHRIVPVHEALTPLISGDRFVKKLAGLRMRSRVTLEIRKGSKDPWREITSEVGEVQWTEYGISGICVFQLSRYAIDAINAGEQAQLRLDLMPALTMEELKRELLTRPADDSVGKYLTGLLPAKMIPVLLQRMDLRPEQRAEMLTEKELDRMAVQVKEFTLAVTGNKGCEMAQVCAGGVDTAELAVGTLESTRCPGIYFAGELIDVDGKCGGYNLQWAWSSGAVAGRNAAGEKEEKKECFE